MVFTPPAWVPQLPFDPPDSIPIHEFWSNEQHGRKPFAQSRHPFTCGLSGKSYSALEVKERVDLLARAIAKRLGWTTNEGTPWDKVVAQFSLNTIDYLPATHAVHRLNGIVSPANAAYSASELEHQLRSSGAKALITCIPLLETALKAAKAAGISEDKIFLLEISGASTKSRFPTIDDLINEGKALPAPEPLRWTKGQGARQVAYLCYSSGTSGLPKAVMIAHRNVIANMIQYTVFEGVARKQQGVDTQTELGLLPFSHIYGLVVVAHSGSYRGDQIIVLPKFEFKPYLEAIEKYKINELIIVPPIIITMLKNKDECLKHDLSSVRQVYTGAAPLGQETADDVLKIWPTWHLTQGYGMTESSTVVVSTGENDIFIGSAGTLVPGVKAKIIAADGKEVTEYDQPGELLVQSPSVTLGYLNNERATSEAYVWHEDGRWLCTGDEVCVRKGPNGTEHFVVLDRIKELIKVKAHQVAPAELEAHILTHEYVDDCTVIAIPHPSAGEVPKAFVVKSKAAEGKQDDDVIQAIIKYVEEHKAHYKWLKGGVEFIDVVPKSPSGKILRRLLKDKEKEKRKAQGAKL